MGEMKDATLKSLLMGMKGGEGVAFVANDQLGIIDVYAGLVQGCSYSFGDKKNKTFSLELAKVNCALAISRKSIQDEFLAKVIAKGSKNVKQFNAKGLLELAKKAVEAQEKMANQTPEEVEAWAAKLAKESVAVGEQEYGPDYGKAPMKISTALGIPIVTSQALAPGDIFIVAPSYMNQHKMAIVSLADMPDYKDLAISSYYKEMYEDNLHIKQTESFKQEFQQEPSPWEADVVSEQGDVLTSEGMKKAFEDTWNQKAKPDHPGLYAGEGKPVEQDIAAKIDGIVQQESEQKIKDIEQKLKKINQNHPMAKKIQAELLALKMKFQEQKKYPLQVISAADNLAIAKAQVFATPDFSKMDVDSAIKSAFECVGIGVVKVQLDGQSAAVTVVLGASQYFHHKTLEGLLQSAGGWKLQGSLVAIETNTDGSMVCRADLMRPVKMTAAEKLDATGYGYGSDPFKSAGPAIYATASAASMAQQIYVDASSGSDYSVLSIHVGSEKAIMLKPDGTVLIPEGMTLDEASKKFWDAIGASNPMRSEVKSLTQKYMDLTIAYQDAMKRLVRYEGDSTTPVPEDPRAARFGNIANNL